MDSKGPQEEVLIVINSVKNQEKLNFIDEVIQNNDILLVKNRSITSHSIHKLNPMQLSCPISDVTKASSNHDHSQQKQLSIEKKLQVNQLKSFNPTLSNLQALRNLPRHIHKNHNIKIQCKTQFPLVRSVAVEQFGWSLMSKQNHRELVDLIWTDTYVTQELVNRLRPYQKVNHFPYSTQMGRKDYLFANLNKMKQRHKQEYDYFAKTWIFPEDYDKFKQDIISQKQVQNKFYIVKPVASCQGKGIYLAKKEDILLHTSQNKLLVQEYIENTMLIDGLKFDVRIYVLIKSLQPLNIFVYREGLTRLATNEYERPNDSNYRNGRMHLTNYAINKNNPNFVHNRDFRQDNIGHKRSLASLYEQIEKLGCDAEIVKQKINKIIVKTVLAVYEKMTVSQKNYHSHSPTKRSTKNLSFIDTDDVGYQLKQIKTHRVNNNQQKNQNKIDNSNKCFQLLGFDIMITNKMQPKLIEINHQPSLSSSSPLDHVIKRCLLIDIFNILNLDSKQKQKYLLNKRDVDQVGCLRGIQVKCAKKQLGGIYNQTREDQLQLGGFSCIYPVQNKNIMQTYHKIMPILSLSENQSNNLRRKTINFKTNYPFNQNLQARINKTSLAQKRTQYACHYINMLSHHQVINYDSSIKNSDQLLSITQKQINDCERTQQQTQIRIIHQKGSEFNPLHIVPKIKIKKMTEFQVPKKNLNFTIKYKKNKSQGKQAQHQNYVLHEDSQFFNENRSKTFGRLTFYTNNNKIGFKRNKINSYQIQLTNDHFNNSKHIKQKSYSNQRHTTSQQKRVVAVKVLRQDRKNQYDKMKIITQNGNIEQTQTNNKKHAKQLEKYSYPIFQKKSSTIVTNSGRQSIATSSQTRSIRRNNQFFQRIYEKQLISRITKMKSMKQKLQSLNKSRLSNNKNQQIQYIHKKQIRQFPQNINMEFIQHFSQQKKQKSFSIQKIQTPLSNQLQQNKQTIYQTIKLMQFQEPKNRRVSHIRMQKSTNLKERFNTSMQMFKDEGVNSYRKKL